MRCITGTGLLLDARGYFYVVELPLVLPKIRQENADCWRMPWARCVLITTDQEARERCVEPLRTRAGY